MPLTDEQRQRIVEEAKAWCEGTPYRGNTCIKGVGCDCAQLLFGVYRDAGFVSAETVIPQNYQMNVAMHKRDDTYIDTVRRFAREIPESDVKPGDIVLYKIGRGFSHAGIIVEWPEHVVHALAREGVHAGHGKNWKFGKYERIFLTLKDEHC